MGKDGREEGRERGREGELNQLNYPSNHPLNSPNTLWALYPALLKLQPGLIYSKGIRSHPTNMTRNNGASILCDDGNRNTFETRTYYGI